MTGSRKWAIYEDDDGNEYGVQLDDDTANNVALGFSPYTGTPPLDKMPKGSRMRYVNVVQTSGAAAGLRYRSFPCGKPEATAFGGTATTFTHNALQYAVTSTVGERFKKPVSFNTGLVGSSATVGQSSTGGGGGGGTT